MDTLIGFAIGVIIGVFLGIFLIAAVARSSKSDIYEEGFYAGREYEKNIKYKNNERRQ